MKKIRIAVVGAGWISQEAFMPSINQTPNIEMAAIVSGNAEGARKLAEFYSIPHVYHYGQYDEMLHSGHIDAVYIALPNSMHADFTMRAAKAGIHALVEKPLATTTAECEAMIAAAEQGGTVLMTAYRLHSEPATVAAIEMIRRGDIGTPRIFTSEFGFSINAGNHRLKAEHWGGPLQDIGVYCLNAARHMIGAEPTSAIAYKGRPAGDPRFAEVEESVTAVLRFPNDCMATFTCSFGSAPVEKFRVVGTDGEIEMHNAYRFETAKTIHLTRGGKTDVLAFPQTDNFSGQADYFASCIQGNQRPVPDGYDGMEDVRIMRAIEKAAETGQAQAIKGTSPIRHPTQSMVRIFPLAVRKLMV